jgi:hypothetical protein
MAMGVSSMIGRTGWTGWASPGELPAVRRRPERPAKCRRYQSWWPWSEICDLDADHAGACSFDIISERCRVNETLLRAAGFQTDGSGRSCGLCDSDRFARRLGRRKKVQVITPAGETFTREHQELEAEVFVCLRCSNVNDRGTDRTLASYLTAMGVPEDVQLSADAVRQAIDRMHADIESLSKLLPPDPYR